MNSNTQTMNKGDKIFIDPMKAGIRAAKEVKDGIITSEQFGVQYQTFRDTEFVLTIDHSLITDDNTEVFLTEEFPDHTFTLDEFKLINT
jgi:hypothetical protein